MSLALQVSSPVIYCLYNFLSVSYDGLRLQKEVKLNEMSLNSDKCPKCVGAAGLAL